MTEEPEQPRDRPLIPDQGSWAMPFMVIYRTSDGVTRYEQSGAIDEAALFVERLRNKDAIDQIRIYRMEEIGFAFRPYYKVELGAPDRSGHHDAATASENGPDSFTAEVEVEESLADAEDKAGPTPDGVPEAGQPLPPPPAPVHEPAGANGNGSGRQGLFGR
jgi:hypothetical protein